MALDRLTYRQWRDEQGTSRYPFGDQASLMTSDGLSIDPETFLDAILYPIGAQARLQLTQVEITVSEVILSIGPETGDALATARFNPLDPPADLVLTDTFGRPAGLLISSSDRLAIFQAWGRGVHDFVGGAAEFAASVCVPTPEIGLRGFLLEDGTLLTGDVWFVGEGGIIVRERSGNLRIDIVGEPLFKRKLCEPVLDEGDFPTPRFVQSINGYRGDLYGDFQITVGALLASDQLLRLYPDGPHSLRIAAAGRLNQD